MNKKNNATQIHRNKIAKTKDQKDSSFSSLFILVAILSLAAGYGYNMYSSSSHNSLNTNKNELADNATSTPSRAKIDIVNDIKKARPFLLETYAQGYFPIHKSQFEADIDYVSKLQKHPDFWEKILVEKADEIKELDDTYASLTIDFYMQFTESELEDYLNVYLNPDFNKINQTIEADIPRIFRQESVTLRKIYGEKLYNFVKDFAK